MTPVPSFADLSDRDLLVEVKRLAGAERRATAALIASLAEIDARRLYLGEGCTSLFAYCTRILHLSETHDKLRRAQDLLRHAVPNGDPAEIFDRALTLLVEHAGRTKLAAAKRPRPPARPSARSRHIPSDVKRAVWKRDDGQCGFIGFEGRCAERGFLEFHHVVPYAKGGPATVENIELRCRAHNQHHAHEVFGVGPLHVREAAALYGTCGADSVRTESEGDRGLWKLPDLRTRRAASTRSLENAQDAFSTATTGPSPL